MLYNKLYYTTNPQQIEVVEFGLCFDPMQRNATQRKALAYFLTQVTQTTQEKYASRYTQRTQTKKTVGRAAGMLGTSKSRLKTQLFTAANRT